MSESFNDRRKALEEKWAHDKETRFKVLARRDRLLGEWAAGELGLTGHEMQVYAKSIVEADLSRHGDDDVLKKIREDFAARKIAHSDHVIRSQMEKLLTIAGEQVSGESRKT